MIPRRFPEVRLEQAQLRWEKVLHNSHELTKLILVDHTGVGVDFDVGEELKGRPLIRQRAIDGSIRLQYAPSRMDGSLPCLPIRVVRKCVMRTRDNKHSPGPPIYCRPIEPDPVTNLSRWVEVPSNDPYNVFFLNTEIADFRIFRNGTNSEIFTISQQSTGKEEDFQVFFNGRGTLLQPAVVGEVRMGYLYPPPRSGESTFIRDAATTTVAVKTIVHSLGRIPESTAVLHHKYIRENPMVEIEAMAYVSGKLDPKTGNCGHRNVINFATPPCSDHICAYLVTPFISGGDLFDGEFIQQVGKFADESAARCVGDISSALSFLHSIGISHSDISRENILVDVLSPEGPRFILTDLGQAIFHNVCSSTGLFTLLPPKPIGFATGKPYYNCPDTYCPWALGPVPYSGFKVDMWQLGVLLITSCTGCNPFIWRDEIRAGSACNDSLVAWLEKIHLEDDGISTMEIYKINSNGDFRLLGHLGDLVEPAILDLIKQLLQVDPSVRISADDVLLHTCVARLPP